MQFIDVIHVVGDESTGRYIAVPIDISVSAAPSIGDTASGEYAAVPENSQTMAGDHPKRVRYP